ncbi:MAG: hypothetical protein JWP75_2682 [Frondihabitans sp.]|nr:hypothetical protein [Frondihabitans sp.]
MTRTHRHTHRATEAAAPPADPKDPGNAFLWAEIRADRRGEWILLPKAVAALVFIAVIVVIRQAFFV